MSAQAKKDKPAPKPKLSDSILSGNVKLGGVAKTTNGFCVIEVEISPEGQVVKQRLEASERYPQFVSARAKQLQLRLALETQRSAGLPKSAIAMQKLTTAGRNWGSY